MKVCYWCGTDCEGLRPYGPGGSWCCVDCALADDDRFTECAGRFHALVDAAEAISPTGIVVIDESGPHPLDPADMT